MRSFLLGLGIFALGCSAGHGGTDGGGDMPGDGADGGIAAEACKIHDCSNTVDAVLVPMLVADGFDIVPEDPNVLCRRMAVDLTGITPLAHECDGMTPAQMADHFMTMTSAPNVPDGSPPYVFVNRRWWADSFLYDVIAGGTGKTFYAYILQLDKLVGQLYAGDIGYDVFARKVLASPGFARRFGIFELSKDYVQIASQAFRVFLGREALPSEAEDFGNLWRAWSTKYVSDVQAIQKDYPDCPTMPVDSCRHYEMGLDSTRCAGAQAAACSSTVLGAGAVIPTTPGFTAIAQISAADQQMLETAGKLMAADPQFAEAAVDRALVKYLGWWKAGFYKPDYQVPAIRQALAKKFVADGYDIRKLEREIVTSLLYTQASALTQTRSVGAPIWSFGPTKLFYAEAWLDSLVRGVAPSATKIGGCDFRYSSGQNNDTELPGYFSFPDASYKATAEGLGGCQNLSAHSDFSGVVVAINRRTLLAKKCVGAIKAPPTPAALFDSVFPGIGRPPTPDEKNAILPRMTADDGCLNASCDMQVLADHFCTSLFGSSLFTFY